MFHLLVEAAWSGQSAIINAPGTVSALQQIFNFLGATRPVTHFDKAEPSHRWPGFLPDPGKSVRFAWRSFYRQLGDRKIAVPIAQYRRTIRNLMPGGTNPRAICTFRALLYAQAGTVLAAPFDAQRLQLTGAAVPVVQMFCKAPAPAPPSTAFPDRIAGLRQWKYSCTFSQAGME